MTPVAQKLLIAASDGTLHTGTDLSHLTSLTKVGSITVGAGGWIVRYGFDKFVAQSTTSPEIIYYSFDGVAWTKATVPALDAAYINKEWTIAIRLFYVGGYWISTCAGGFLVSADGISWIMHDLGGGVTSFSTTTDAVYRPETSTWFISCSNGDVFYCAVPNPLPVTGAWVRKTGAIPSTTVWSMAYGYDSIQLANVFIAAVPGGFYRSLDGYNWTKAPATITSTSNHIRFTRTDDASRPAAWTTVGTPTSGNIFMGSTTAPYTNAFDLSAKAFLSVPGTVRGMVWDDTYYGVLGTRTSGTSSFPMVQITPESLVGNFTAANPGGSFPVTAGIGVTSISIYLLDAAPTNILPAAGALVTTPGPVLSATLVRTASTDFQNAQWQIDTVNTFDSPNLRTVNKSVINGYSGVQTYALPASQALTSDGTYYIRARSITFDGPLSPWSAATSFTVTIPPVSTPTAVTATNLTDYWPTFGATQSAYGGSTSKLEFQFATDSAFSNIISSYTQPDTNYTASAVANPSPYRNPDTTFIFDSGTYWVRARQWSVFGLVSGWTAGVSFTTSPSVPILSGTTTVSGKYVVGSKVITAPAGIVSTSHPTISWLASANKNMTNYPRAIHMQIQTASDTAFTSNQTSTDDKNVSVAAGFNASGNVYVFQRVTPGQVYARGVLVDDFGMQSVAYLDTASFSISHPPASLPSSPVNGSLVTYDTNGQIFIWQFNDSSPGDYQTAYQILVTRVSDGSLAFDTGKITSGVSTSQIILATALKGVNLAWQVRTWDMDDNVGLYSKALTVTFLDPPVITIISPAAGGTVTTGRPTITWSVGGTAPQKIGVVTITDQATNQVVYSSKNPTNMQSVTPAQNILENTHTYLLKVDVYTTFGQSATLSQTFTASYVAPDAPVYVVDASDYDQLGYIDINWGSTAPDSYFYTWTVWRRVLGTDDWVQIFVTTNPYIIDYQDWTAVTGIYYEYIVSQDADRSGLLLGSSMGNPNPSVMATSGGWWFIDPVDNTNNFYVNVTADTFTDEYEEATFNIIGRGRGKDVGTHLGLTGSVTATIRPSYGMTAQQRYYALRAMRKQNKRIVLRDPFGNFYHMAIGNIQIVHVAGVGPTEMYDVTIPLDEVII